MRTRLHLLGFISIASIFAVSGPCMAGECYVGADDAPAGGGGGTVGSTGVAPPTVAPQQPPVQGPNEQDIRSKAERELLASLGVKDPDEARAAIKAAKDAADKELSSSQRNEKLLKESSEANAGLKTQLDAANAQIASLVAAGEMRDRLDRRGVDPKARRLAEAAYADELALQKRKAFEDDKAEAKFFEDLKKAHPSLFSGTQSAADTTSDRTVERPRGANTSPVRVLPIRPDVQGDGAEKRPDAKKKHPLTQNWASSRDSR